jgi:hypothetical protein
MTRRLAAPYHQAARAALKLAYGEILLGDALTFFKDMKTQAARHHGGSQFMMIWGAVNEWSITVASYERGDERDQRLAELATGIKAIGALLLGTTQPAPMPAPAPVIDFKSRAAGERDDA